LADYGGGKAHEASAMGDSEIANAQTAAKTWIMTLSQRNRLTCERFRYEGDAFPKGLQKCNFLTESATLNTRNLQKNYLCLMNRANLILK
jgi:hypothetical protein